MVALLGPILAQVVTLSLADRTEAREIVNQDSYAEAATRPAAALALLWKHTRLLLGYAPSFTLTPLGSESRELLVYHTAALNGSYVLGRTVLFVNESVGYGSQNFQEQALAGGALATAPGVPGPAAGNNTPAPLAIGTVLGGPTSTNGATGGTVNPTRNPVTLSNKVVRFESLATSVGVTHTASRNLVYGGDTGYALSGAVRPADQAQYPLVQGPRWSAFTRYGWGHHDNVTSTLALQYAVVSMGRSVWLGALTEDWAHRFNVHTSTILGVGASGTRSPVLNNGTVVAYGIYPTVNASIFESTILERGKLSLGFTVSAAPALDLTTLAVDPRVSLSATTGWTRRRFFSMLGVGSALSVRGSNNTGALDSVTGSTSFGYMLGRAVSIDTGLRAAWQSYGGTTVIPMTYAGFVGMNFATIWPFH